MHYRIANMRISFCGEPRFCDSPRWTPFLDIEDAPADYTVERRFVPQLPELADGHYFYDSVHERNYCGTREIGTHLYMDVLQAIHPWSTRVHSVYEECALPHILLHGNALVMHASYIETPYGAILFTAPSGTGKSTQAELWRQHRGASVVNGDRAVLRFEDGPKVFGYPMSGSSDDCHNRTLPLAALVRLQQAPENAIRRLHGRELLRTVLNGSYHDPKHPEDLLRKTDIALQLADAPVFELSCRPDLGAVETLERAIEKGGCK